ncbi:MAG: ribosome biogenesis GTPase YlqF [Lachnospira sp.]
MTKARRMMEEDIKLVDLVIEIVDARIPMSSRNPDIDKLAKNKSRIILLNKSDLADDAVTDEWISYFKEKGFYCLKLNSRLNTSNRAVNSLITSACADRIERDKKRGINNRTIKAMIVGIPNVGKSTFINSFTGRKSAKTGNKPGVTKGKQWIRIGGSVELLDTPGILWPKIEDRNVGERLAMIGSINDRILNIEELALKVIKYLNKNYKKMLYERFDITEDILKNVDTEIMMNPENALALCIMDHIARKRGCLKKGGEIDYEKAAGCILDDFREGKIGKISLERV